MDDPHKMHKLDASSTLKVVICRPGFNSSAQQLVKRLINKPHVFDCSTYINLDSVDFQPDNSLVAAYMVGTCLNLLQKDPIC